MGEGTAPSPRISGLGAPAEGGGKFGPDHPPVQQQLGLVVDFVLATERQRKACAHGSVAEDHFVFQLRRGEVGQPLGVLVRQPIQQLDGAGQVGRRAGRVGDGLLAADALDEAVMGNRHVADQIVSGHCAGPGAEVALVAGDRVGNLLGHGTVGQEQPGELLTFGRQRGPSFGRFASPTSYTITPRGDGQRWCRMQGDAGGVWSLQPIDRASVETALNSLGNREIYLHVETTAGAYTAGGFGAFVRNVGVHLRRAVVTGTGPFRVGLELEAGWVYAEGVTDWEAAPDGAVLLAGYDAQGRVTVLCEASPRPLIVSPPAAAWTSPVSAAVPGAEPPSRERAVVVALAHPDDETFGCGGTIALYTRGGVPVTVICATRGEQGRNMGNPHFATRESLPNLRTVELQHACAALGVGDLRLLGIWDKTTEFRDPDVLSERIGTILSEVRPSLVITSHPQFGGHPDHCAIGEATIRAVGALDPDDRPVVRCMVPPRVAEREGLNLESVDISEVIDTKLEAVRAHRSQSGLAPKRPGASEHYTVFRV